MVMVMVKGVGIRVRASVGVRIRASVGVSVGVTKGNYPTS